VITDPPRPGPTAPWRLVGEIVGLSLADTWDEAKREWELDHVYFADTPGTCLCGKTPIREHCVLVNRANSNRAVVGSCCVKKFLPGLSSSRIFAGLRRVARSTGAALNEACIEYAHSKGYINDWERTFYLDTIRKRKLSRKQHAKRVEINERVLALVGEVQHAG
jgi:hypothetical protein